MKTPAPTAWPASKQTKDEFVRLLISEKAWAYEDRSDDLWPQQTSTRFSFFSGREPIDRGIRACLWAKP